MTASPDFWRSSGWRLLDRRDDGRHLATDGFLRAYLLRPELRPVDESCAAERALHAALVESPRQPITPVGLLRLKDRDARENYEVFAAFRDLLLRQPTLEDAYLALALGGAPGVPPLFAEHLAHAILRGILDGCADGCGCALPSACSARNPSPSGTAPSCSRTPTRSSCTPAPAASAASASS